MVEIAPFAPFVITRPKSPNLSNVICPPYDVISVADYHRLSKRSPPSIWCISSFLGQRQGDRYAIAAQYWQRWQNNRTCWRTSSPASMDMNSAFWSAPSRISAAGFSPRSDWEPPGKGDIRPHERTFPKHKEDRLQLMRATQREHQPDLRDLRRSEKSSGAAAGKNEGQSAGHRAR